jgi:hypothetical protein
VFSHIVYAFKIVISSKPIYFKSFYVTLLPTDKFLTGLLNSSHPIKIVFAFLKIPGASEMFIGLVLPDSNILLVSDAGPEN